MQNLVDKMPPAFHHINLMNHICKKKLSLKRCQEFHSYDIQCSEQSLKVHLPVSLEHVFSLLKLVPFNDWKCMLAVAFPYYSGKIDSFTNLTKSIEGSHVKILGNPELCTGMFLFFFWKYWMEIQDIPLLLHQSRMGISHFTRSKRGIGVNLRSYSYLVQTQYCLMLHIKYHTIWQM